MTAQVENHTSIAYVCQYQVHLDCRYTSTHAAFQPQPAFSGSHVGHSRLARGQGCVDGAYLQLCCAGAYVFISGTPSPLAPRLAVSASCSAAHSVQGLAHRRTGWCGGHAHGSVNDSWVLKEPSVSDTHTHTHAHTSVHANQVCKWRPGPAATLALCVQRRLCSAVLWCVVWPHRLDLQLETLAAWISRTFQDGQLSEYCHILEDILDVHSITTMLKVGSHLPRAGPVVYLAQRARIQRKKQTFCIQKAETCSDGMTGMLRSHAGPSDHALWARSTTPYNLLLQRCVTLTGGHKARD